MHQWTYDKMIVWDQIFLQNVFSSWKGTILFANWRLLLFSFDHPIFLQSFKVSLSSFPLPWSLSIWLSCIIPFLVFTITPGQDCEQLVNLCDEVPCQNNGSCIRDGATFSCVCPIRFEGDLCETPVVDCKEGFCQNGGSCNYDSGEEVAELCSCPDGFRGKQSFLFRFRL